MTWAWILVGVLVLVLLAWHLTYTAARLDRLHAKVSGALTALDAQFVRRAEAAVELANHPELDPASALILADAATTALDIHRLDQERLAAEDRLGRHVALVLADVGDLGPAGTRLLAAERRVETARHMHELAVDEVLVVRRKPLVRIFHLAGHAPMPRHLPEL